MFIKEFITYDGVDLYNAFKVYVVRTQSGLVDSPFAVNRTIREEKIPGRDKPYFYGVDKEPITFTLEFYRETPWTDVEYQDFIKLLFNEDYKVLTSVDFTDVVYYAMPVGDSRKLRSDILNGIFTISFRCDSPYAYSNQQLQTFDLSANIDSITITLENRSNCVRYYKPELEIQLLDTTTEVTIQNITIGGETFKLTGLDTSENIYIDNQNEKIISNSGLPRYSNFEGKKWLRLIYGENQLIVHGKCTITVRSQFPIAL